MPQLSLKGRALRYLAQREHSRAELERKLAAHAQEVHEAHETHEAQAGQAGQEGAPADAATRLGAMLDELAARGWQSDVRAAESLLRTLGPRAGRLRLAQALREKGLDADVVARTLALASDTELERARALWQRRFGRPAADRAERARQMRFLAGRGFDADVVRRVVPAPAGCEPTD